jgi:2-oxoglutarate dehydrogenase E2 component (dihydrolipoamide succinyltransferase)
MSFFIKASVAALREQPIVNAVINGKDIVYRDYIDISVAVATPSGLMVPVLRNCEDQNFAQIEKNIAALAQKGKEGTIGLEDMAGGTFTISNGGTFGSLMGTPIINTPQSAILGMHATINRPVVRGENIVARPMMYLALTYDHRIIDGREAATFLKRIQAEIEEPTRLLLDI